MNIDAFLERISERNLSLPATRESTAARPPEKVGSPGTELEFAL